MFFYFSQLNLRETMRQDIFSLDPQHVWGPTAITTTSKHMWKQLPFLSKSYLYLFRNFLPIEET